MIASAMRADFLSFRLLIALENYSYSAASSKDLPRVLMPGIIFIHADLFTAIQFITLHGYRHLLLPLPKISSSARLH